MSEGEMRANPLGSPYYIPYQIGPREDYPHQSRPTNNATIHLTIHLTILIVGEPHIGKRAMIPPEFKHARSSGGSIVRYFSINLPSGALVGGPAARVIGRWINNARIWRKKQPEAVTVGFHDRSLNDYDGNPKGRYSGCTFDTVAICYDPCSPQETFELLWTKWLPEIRHFLPKSTPIVLVEVGGGKTEGVLTVDVDETRRGRPPGNQVAKELGATFVKCPRGSPGDAIATLARIAFKRKNSERKAQASRRRP